MRLVAKYHRKGNNVACEAVFMRLSGHLYFDLGKL